MTDNTSNWRNELRLYTQLPRGIYALTFAGFSKALGEFVFPFLALIFSQSYGFSATQIGLIIFAVATARYPGSIIGGYLGDKIGQRRVFLLADIINIILIGLGGLFLGSIALIPILVAAMFFSGMTDPVFSSIMAGFTDDNNRKHAFSMEYWGYNAGIALAPILAAGLFVFQPTWLFFGDALTSFIGWVFIYLFVRPSEGIQEDVSDEQAVEDAFDAKQVSALNILVGSPKLMLFSCALFLLAIVYGQVEFAIPLHYLNVFGEQSAALYGWTMSFSAVLVFTLTPLLTVIFSKAPTIRLVQFAGVAFIIGFGMFGVGGAFIVYLCATAIWTIGEILKSTNSSVYIAENAPPNMQARFFAIIPIFAMVGDSIAAPIGGLIIDSYGTDYVWYMCAVLSFLATLFLIKTQSYETQLTRK